MSEWLLGVDVGGTFTDAVLIAEGNIYTAKVSTTPDDQSEGVVEAIKTVLSQPGSIRKVTLFAHGTTVATNALLQEKVARTVFIATQNFTDIIELGRQSRADLYRLCVTNPAPLVPPDRRVGVDERIAIDGVIRSLSAMGTNSVVERCRKLQPEAIAICLLHSYKYPEHEKQLGKALGEAFPDVHISLSHEVVGTFREFERAATTEIDAALSPHVGRYLLRLTDRIRKLSLPEPMIMQSSGGLTSSFLASQHGSLTILSGPAGGCAGAAWIAKAAGVKDTLCFDMGGTSCDISLIQDGLVSETSGRKISGRTIALPMLDIETIGAGGGSIAWRDAGGALHVGPQSAGADPGPAAYQRGGNNPTVTDANVILGYLPSGSEISGKITLNRDSAERTVGTLARELGLTLNNCAEGIRQVANAEMLRALRVMTVERGIDPRKLTLIAFGGAGPLHAAAIAEELGIDTVVCPQTSGVLAAFGLVVGEKRRDVQRTVMLADDSLTDDAIALYLDELSGRARDEIGDPNASIRVNCDLRYRGQAFELTVKTEEPVVTAESLKLAFTKAHEDLYGYSDNEGTVELVKIRVSAISIGQGFRTDAPESPHIELNGHATVSRRIAIFDGETHSTTIVRGEPQIGDDFEGPTIIELPQTTVVIPPSWKGNVDRSGVIFMKTSNSNILQ